MSEFREINPNFLLVLLNSDTIIFVPSVAHYSWAPNTTQTSFTHTPWADWITGHKIPSSSWKGGLLPQHLGPKGRLGTLLHPHTDACVKWRDAANPPADCGLMNDPGVVSRKTTQAKWELWEITNHCYFKTLSFGAVLLCGNKQLIHISFRLRSTLKYPDSV